MKATANHSTDSDLSLQYLQAEIARIDVFIQRAVWCWRVAGQDPADNFRGLYVSDGEVDNLLARPMGSNWGQIASLPAEVEQKFQAAEEQANLNLQRILAQAEQTNISPRLIHLVTTFNLNRFELDILLGCLAPTVDLRYERVYSYLQDDVTQKRPTINLLLDIFRKDGIARWNSLSYFAPDSPLFKYHLLDFPDESQANGRPLLSRTLHVDDTVLAWLLGTYQPQGLLNEHVKLYAPHSETLDALLISDIPLDMIQLDNPQAMPLVICFGPDHLSQTATARRLAAQANRTLLQVDLAPLIEIEKEPLEVLRVALRDARLIGAIPFLTGWDACLSKEGVLLPSLLAELHTYPDLIIVAGKSRWQAEGLERNRRLFWLEFPVPFYSQRLTIWQHFLDVNTPQDQHLDDFDPVQLEALANQFALHTGQIRDAVASAKDMAAQRGTPLQMKDVFLAARTHSNPRLATLAHKIEPRYDWDDIILPTDQRTILNEIVAAVRGRSRVLEQWGVGQKLVSSAAITVLFAGDPGTGKTMAAEVIAKELNLDLYRIDLSTLISKYIGETEKNLEKIFSEAESSNAILFFDEADAIFGKRSEVKDAHDRYANIEVSYLLQRMEAYDGVTILATNLRANLDEAFTRRLQFAVDFPFPDPPDRLRIWQTLFPPDVPKRSDLDFELLAKRFKLAGGNIRNVIVSAAYQAAADGGQVTMQHLLHGTRRELQKMGRLVGEDDLKID